MPNPKLRSTIPVPTPSPHVTAKPLTPKRIAAHVAPLFRTASLVALVLVAPACARFPDVTRAQAPFANTPAPPLAPIDRLLASAAQDRQTDATRAAASARAAGLRGKESLPTPDAARIDMAARADQLRSKAQGAREADDSEPASADQKADRATELRAKASALRAKP